MNKENEEKYINIDFDYLTVPDKNLTKAMFNFLIKNEIDVYKSTAPVGIWNYETFYIKCRQVKSSDFKKLTSECYEEFKGKTILLLEVLIEYNLVDDFYFIIRYTEV